VITISKVFFRCTFCIAQPLLSLPVPGLAKKRPNLLIGETNLMDVVLQPSHARYSSRWSHFSSGAGSSCWSVVRGTCWGHVPFVRKAEMGLRSYRSFRRYSEGTTFHIRFRLNRIPLRREYQTLDSSFNEERGLFPTKQHLSLATHPPKDTSIKSYNPLLIVGQPSSTSGRNFNPFSTSRLRDICGLRPVR
jgi:helicase MOV-10